MHSTKSKENKGRDKSIKENAKPYLRVFFSRARTKQ